MEGEADEMAHEDIWDDSALVNSWNEALAEYKKYHSIHATGGSLQDMPPEHAKPETQRGHDAESAPPPAADEAAMHDQSDHHAESTGGATKDRIDQEDFTANGNERGPGQGMTGASGGASVMPPPQALLGSVQDESLKRLLMSWYYAGYYTGIYEGQQNIKTSNETLHEYRPHPSLDLHEPIDHRMGDAS